MIHLNVVLTVKDAADIPFVRSTLIEMGTRAHSEPGCRRFEVYQSQSDPRAFFLNEHWDDAESLDIHRKTKLFVDTYMPKVVPKLERAPHPCDLLT